MKIEPDDAEAIVAGLEETCWQCGVRGVPPSPKPVNWISSSDPEECGICYGKGRRLTKAGEMMLAFLKRWTPRPSGCAHDEPI